MSIENLQEKVGAVVDGKFGPNTYRAARDYFKLSHNQGAHFFAQTGHETGDFRWFSENLNYSAAGLRKTFRRYFPTDALAAQYARKPEAIANRVYANRMGNGPESSGDGWRYRGRGALQLTGRYNYDQFSKYMGCPIDPSSVATDYAFESAMFFFDKNKLWGLCDEPISLKNIRRVTRIINGGYNGIDHRVELTNKVLRWK